MELIRTNLNTSLGGNSVTNNSNTSNGVKTEELSLSATDAIQNITVDDIKDLKIAVSASDALNGNFITGNKNVLSHGKLTYTKRDDGTVLIKRNGEAVGFTLLENIKTNVQGSDTSNNLNNERKTLMIRNYNYFQNKTIKSILSDVDVLYNNKDFVGPIQQRIDRELSFKENNGLTYVYKYGNYINIYKDKKYTHLTFNVDGKEENLDMLLDDKVAKYVDFKNIKNIVKINNEIQVSFENGNVIKINNNNLMVESKNGEIKDAFLIDKNNKLYDARKYNNTNSDKEKTTESSKTTEASTKSTMESTQPKTEPSTTHETTSTQDPTEPSTESTTENVESTTRATSSTEDSTEQTGTQDPTEPTSEYIFTPDNKSLKSIVTEINANNNGESNISKVEYNDYVNIYTDGNEAIPTYNVNGEEIRMDYLMDSKLSKYVDLNEISSITSDNGDIDITFKDNSVISITDNGQHIDGYNGEGDANFSSSIAGNNLDAFVDFNEE